MILWDKKFISKMQDILINEMLVIPARIRDGLFKLSDILLGYRFEYLRAPEDLPEVGLTPKELVWQEGHIKLYRYKKMTDVQKNHLYL